MSRPSEAAIQAAEKVLLRGRHGKWARQATPPQPGSPFLTPHDLTQAMLEAAYAAEDES